MWPKKPRPTSPTPRPNARVEAPTGADRDGQLQPAGTQPLPPASLSAPSIPAGPLVIDPSLDRVGTGCRVLLVDERPERRSVIHALVQARAGAGTVVAEAASAADALSALQAGAVDAAVVEIQMPVPVGIAVIAALRAEQAELVIVVCSFHAGPAARHEALKAGADAYLTKPVSPRDLLLACRRSRRPSLPASNDRGFRPVESSPDPDGPLTVTLPDSRPVFQCVPS
jgi:two-component system chemotaxis response regulator CheY